MSLNALYIKLFKKLSMYYLYLFQINIIFLLIKCSDNETGTNDKSLSFEMIENVKNIWNNDAITTTNLFYESNNFWLYDTEFNREEFGINIELEDSYYDISDKSKDEIENVLKYAKTLEDNIFKSKDIIQLLESLCEYNVYRIKYYELLVQAHGDIINDFYKNLNAKSSSIHRENPERGYNTQNINGESSESYKKKNSKIFYITKYNLFRSKNMQLKLVAEYPKVKPSSMEHIPCVASISGQTANAYDNLLDSKWMVDAMNGCISYLSNNKFCTDIEKMYAKFDAVFLELEQILKNVSQGIPETTTNDQHHLNLSLICIELDNGTTENVLLLYVRINKYLRKLAKIEEQLYKYNENKDLRKIAIEKSNFFDNNMVLCENCDYKNILQLYLDFSVRKFNYAKYQVIPKNEIHRMVINY
ncbi:hypothetical protein SLOPH_1080 [Spraguea lophii 42_110]|uniref:Uncharacterized protein n=1 Tax=Spraguea lophii (strain 42_110) TaxID=1358809 RepID=S7XRM0_SPRLO|nr:hypothetical protein SLOPH_1080 [Spraguea lophii 42_110]